MNKLFAFTEKHGVWFAFGWVTWHWGLLFVAANLAYPFPRLIFMKVALTIDALCFIYFFVWLFHRNYKDYKSPAST